MFETLRIYVLGSQPVARISNKQLDRIIKREFPQHIDQVITQLGKIESETSGGKNRISAAILKLSNKHIDSIGHYIEIANNDYRDVLSQAEYPRRSKFGFDKLDNSVLKKIYLDDWKEYSKWLTAEN